MLVLQDFVRTIPDVSKLVTNTALNRKIETIEQTMPDVSNLVTNTALDIEIQTVEKNTNCSLILL